MDIQRRQLLKSIGLGTAALTLASCGGAPAPTRPSPAPGPGPSPTPPAPSPGAQVGTRQSVIGMGANHPTIQTYRAAVQAMRALPASDTRNLESQARIHQDRCPHGNWYFLPWHRAYLHRFEAICRELTGENTFRLPYWDWSSDPRVPPPFWGQGNPLDHPRDAGPNDRALPEMVGQPVIDNVVLPETDFEQFASGESTTQRGGSFLGPLEARPHNHVHNFIGGDMVTFMSPRDPVFWLHHANVDRIWAMWNSRGNGNTSSSQWRDFQFNADFVDTQGNPVNVRVTDVEDTRQLGYTYDDVGDFNVPAPQAVMAPQAATLEFAAANDKPSIPGRTLSVNVPANVLQLRRAVSRAQAAGPNRVFVVISDIDAPETEQVVVRVFVNKPDATPSTPTSDPHFAGSFAFFVFSHAREHGHEQASYRIELTETLRRLALTNELGSELQIQLLPVGLAGRNVEGAHFTARKVNVVTR